MKTTIKKGEYSPKQLIDRVLTRCKENKELGEKIHLELIDKYICVKPKIKDLQELVESYDYNFNDNQRLETKIKIQTTFDLLYNEGYN